MRDAEKIDEIQHLFMIFKKETTLKPALVVQTFNANSQESEAEGS